MAWFQILVHHFYLYGFKLNTLCFSFLVCKMRIIIVLLWAYKMTLQIKILSLYLEQNLWSVNTGYFIQVNPMDLNHCLISLLILWHLLLYNILNIKCTPLNYPCVSLWVNLEITYCCIFYSYSVYYYLRHFLCIVSSAELFDVPSLPLSKLLIKYWIWWTRPKNQAMEMLSLFLPPAPLHTPAPPPYYSSSSEWYSWSVLPND